MRQITFVSYSGGTGKTTLAVNISAMLAKNGKNVCIVDADMYSPSLQYYFGLIGQNNDKKTITDFLVGKTKVEEVLVDIATFLEPPLKGSLPGKILCCFAGQKREDIVKFEYAWSKMHILKRLISLRDELEKRYGIDYIIFDTSPGNFGLARILLRTSHSGIFTIRTGEIDNEGMGNVINYIQAVNAECTNEYKRNVYYLVVNMFSGYCIPKSLLNKFEVESGTLPSITNDLIRTLKPQDRSSVIKFIPCYCDIRFAQREFLTVLGYPEHAFSQKISELIDLINA
jgi:MinD-like ATPase involved in chromosome partitioning or flagellar assembly